MAASNLNLGKASGGVLNIQPADGTTNTSLVLPTSGTVVATDVAVTDNAIARYDGITGKVQNSGVIVDDNGNVGIGTSSPAAQVNYKFVTLDGLSGSGVSARINGVTGLYTYSTVNDSRVSEQRNLPLVFETNNTERMRIDASGNVGIGVTPSGNYKLQTNGAIYTSLGSGGLSMSGDGSPDTSFLGYNYTNVSGTEIVPTINRSSWRLAFGNGAIDAITFGRRAANASVNSWTQAMTLDSSGNLGIGVTPSAWTGSYKAIDIGSSASISTNNSAEIAIQNNAYYNGSNYFYKQSAGASLYDMNTSQHKWYTAPSGTAGNPITWTNAMTLDANGKLIFGANTFGARISITGDYAAYGDTHITMKNNSGSNFGNVIFLNAAGTQVGYIQASSTATAYITSSDYRLKDDIKPMIGSIERLMELKPCNFVWKETGHRVDGFIAHEVQEVVPEAATGVKDEMMEEEYELSPRVEATYDEEGNELTPRVEAVIGKRQVPKYQGIDQSKLVPLLTSALQDAILKIELLENRIEILEAK